MNEQKNIDPKRLGRWIRLAIAILSALARALAENATSFVGNLLNL